MKTDLSFSGTACFRFQWTRSYCFCHVFSFKLYLMRLFSICAPLSFRLCSSWRPWRRRAKRRREGESWQKPCCRPWQTDTSKDRRGETGNTMYRRLCSFHWFSKKINLCQICEAGKVRRSVRRGHGLIFKTGTASLTNVKFHSESIRLVNI